MFADDFMKFTFLVFVVVVAILGAFKLMDVAGLIKLHACSFIPQFAAQCYFVWYFITSPWLEGVLFAALLLAALTWILREI
ncbi:MAG: hypothetical protein JW834_00715 [Candidatus Diapherotrites archaeon]|nr:hypothetical protein [Candidatus Diapherotrites archaeon]